MGKRATPPGVTPLCPCRRKLRSHVRRSPLHSICADKPPSSDEHAPFRRYLPPASGLPAWSPCQLPGVAPLKIKPACAGLRFCKGRVRQATLVRWRKTIPFPKQVWKLHYICPIFLPKTKPSSDCVYRLRGFLFGRPFHLPPHPPLRIEPTALGFNSVLREFWASVL